MTRYVVVRDRNGKWEIGTVTPMQLRDVVEHFPRDARRRGRQIHRHHARRAGAEPPRAASPVSKDERRMTKPGASASRRPDARQPLGRPAPGFALFRRPGPRLLYTRGETPKGAGPLHPGHNAPRHRGSGRFGGVRPRRNLRAGARPKPVQPCLACRVARRRRTVRRGRPAYVAEGLGRLCARL